MSANFYGKYRGVVTNNVDPMQSGRIQAQVPSVAGHLSTTWVMPCAMPNPSKKIGSALPRAGAAVWIEFEEGDLNRPIWSGLWFHGQADTPPSLRNF